MLGKQQIPTQGKSSILDILLHY